MIGPSDFGTPYLYLIKSYKVDYKWYQTLITKRACSWCVGKQ